MGVEHPDDIRFAFRSERLVFRAIEDNEADRQFVFEMQNDPVCTAMGSMGVLRPESRASFEGFMTFAKSCPHVAVACLPPLLEAGGAADGKGEGGARLSPRDVGTAQLKDTTPIGFVIIMNFNKQEGVARHRNGMLGISILGPYTGKGYGGEMINWMLDWAFRRLNLHRVELGCWSVNTNAIKLYRSLGFVEEGREREALIVDRKWADVLRFGMLEHEWERLRGISD